MRNHLACKRTHFKHNWSMISKMACFRPHLRLKFTKNIIIFLPFRENEKIRIRRLAKQALHEWHNVTQKSLEGAVARFAAAIGLHQGDGDSNFNAEEDQGETIDLLEGDTILKPLILCLLVSFADNLYAKSDNIIMICQR